MAKGCSSSLGVSVVVVVLQLPPVHVLVTVCVVVLIVGPAYVWLCVVVVVVVEPSGLDVVEVVPVEVAGPVT
jgi:hypothetical protein